jgi:uncharacterized Zn ribbon protein
MSNLSNRPQNKNFGSRTGKQTSERRSKEFSAKYYLSPKICPSCNSAISYEKRRNKFCSRSCSATFNNTDRVVVNRKNASSKPASNGKRLFCAVTFNQCPTCEKHYRVVNSKNTIFCTQKCNPEFYTKQSYRTQCKFKVSPATHPSLFPSKLIEDFGWYVPTNHKNPTNLTGVCWDHLYRIQEGYKNKIPTEIISHPANAELVPWRVNISRKQSVITYEELLNRIKLWDSGVYNLPTFL